MAPWSLAIIGCGRSGMQAARAAVQRGLDFHIYEKRPIKSIGQSFIKLEVNSIRQESDKWCINDAQYKLIILATGTTLRDPPRIPRTPSAIRPDFVAHTFDPNVHSVLLYGWTTELVKMALEYNHLGKKVTIVCPRELYDPSSSLVLWTHQIPVLYTDILCINGNTVELVGSSVTVDKLILVGTRMPNIPDGIRPAQTKQGTLVVTFAGQTSVPGIFAVGSLVGCTDDTSVARIFNSPFFNS